MVKKVGFFGGTFDPIHHGHLNLAYELWERKGLDEVLFCPAFLSPHKTETQPASVVQRLEMVSLAIQHQAAFQLFDWEAKRECPSYTVDTLRELRRRDRETGTETEYFLMLGDDCLGGLLSWREVDVVMDLAPPLIACRNRTESLVQAWEDGPVKEAVLRGLVPSRQVQIESREIRKRIFDNKDCYHLVPREVLDYIKKNELYS